MEIKQSVLVCSLILGLVVSSQTQEPACCDQASGVCASACKQLSLVTLASESDADTRDRQLRSVQVLCPTQLVSFWQCMNETLTALNDAASWQGRYCCSLAQTRVCQIACLTAQETSDLSSGCRLSDESPVYQCLEKQEEYDSCCGQSKKQECETICKTYIRELPKSNKKQGIRKRLNAICEREPGVLSCVANLTQATTVHNTERYLPCCSKGRHGECQDACRKALRTASSDQAIMDIVERSCGNPRPDDKMWQCFLQNSEPRGTEIPSKIDRLGMDAAKLHCCHRASSTTCRRLCFKTYSREWTGSWSDLDSVCLSSPNEASLRSCVDEVEESCEFGCDGLSFCSAFNNRHSDLFRCCNPAADLAARQQFEQWKALSYIPLSETMHLPLKDLSECATEKWKTVACALQLKPCHPKTHVSQICRSDCVSLLHECVDFDSFPSGGHDVSSICELLSPPPGEPCISLSAYTTSSLSQARKMKQVGYTGPVTRPCQSRPCNITESCSINRDCEDESCSAYTCAPGCSLGEVSRIIIGAGTWIRVPTQNPGCHRLCRCSTDGRMEQCANSVCEPESVCWLGRNRIEHGSHFWLDCNLCSCRSGELICSKRQCVMKDAEELNTNPIQQVKLPCNCPALRSPVCGSNGKTYASACLAKCAGLSDSDFTPESCADRDPCEGVFCGNGRRCIANRRICLIPFAKKCQQFQCVPIKCEETWMKSKQVVCDSQNRQHSNLCLMVSAGGLLAHRGACYHKDCSAVGVICGVDGETYASECAARSQGIPKDYDGPCRFIGTSDGSNLEPACPKVVCPKLPRNCVGATPPGACCPVCGGILLVIFSPTQVLKLADASDTQLITTEDVSRRLNSLVQTAQCQVGVYLGHETELIVVVTPVSPLWSKSQLQACISEADRLSTIITQQNPMILVDMALSSFTASFSYHIASSASFFAASNRIIVVLVVFSYKFFCPR